MEDWGTEKCSAFRHGLPASLQERPRQRTSGITSLEGEVGKESAAGQLAQLLSRSGILPVFPGSWTGFIRYLDKKPSEGLSPPGL